ncbi:hypothetical protein, partial [Pseudomonas abietaniphila]|uniref:hypothetical protein n=2 Tax=Pseudomonas abietaniphila TaxID=89065 RepID=UPI001EE70478
MSRDLPGTGSKICACGASGGIESPGFAAAARQIAGKPRSYRGCVNLIALLLLFDINGSNAAKRDEGGLNVFGMAFDSAEGVATVFLATHVQLHRRLLPTRRRSALALGRTRTIWRVAAAKPNDPVIPDTPHAPDLLPVPGRSRWVGLLGSLGLFGLALGGWADPFSR